MASLYFLQLLQHELRFSRLSRTLKLFCTLKGISYKQLEFRSEPVVLPQIPSKGKLSLNMYYSTWNLQHLLSTNFVFICDRHIGGNVRRTRWCNITALQHLYYLLVDVSLSVPFHFLIYFYFGHRNYFFHVNILFCKMTLSTSNHQILTNKRKQCFSMQNQKKAKNYSFNPDV